MTICASGFAYANEEECFAVIEATCGTLTKPAAGNRLFTKDPVSFVQDQEFLDDEQIRAGASRLSPIKGRKMPGEWSAPTYVKPSGTAGTPPEHDLFFQSLMGAKQTNAGVSVVYTLANQLDSFTLWTKKGHTVFVFRGTTVESATFNIAGNEVAGIDWNGLYMEQLWAGTVTSNDTCGIGSATIQLKTGGAQMYVKDMFVEIGTDDNGGAGYELTDVNYTNDTITISPNLGTDQGVDPVVSPWWQSASAEVGEPVHGKIGIVTVGGYDCTVLSAVVTVTNNIKYYIDEKNNLWTAERYGRPGVREIEGNLNLNFLKKGPSYFYRAEYQVSDALIIPAGNVGGHIMEISIPYAEYRTPKLSGDEEFQEDVPFIAVASSSLNDEMSITLK